MTAFIELDVSARFGAADRSTNLERVFSDDSGKAFLAAARTADLAAMRTLAKDGFDLTRTGANDLNAALAYAAYVRPVRSDVIAEMIRLGANPVQPAENGQTLAEALAAAPSAHVLDLLLSSGMTVNTRWQPADQTLLEAAAIYGNVPLVDALLTKGAAVNPASATAGPTAFHTALAFARYRVVARLLAAGADPRLGDPDLSKTSALWQRHRSQTEMFVRQPDLRAGHRALETYLEAQGVLVNGLPTD